MNFTQERQPAQMNRMMPATVDLATEVGETFSLPPCGLTLDILGSVRNSQGRPLHPRHRAPRDDDVLLDIVSTCYVACGGHSGDPVVMLQTMRRLVARGIAVGAHPSYPDIFDFGQTRPKDMTEEQLFAVLVAQLASVAALARVVGTSIRAVKCHGALSFDVAYRSEVTRTLALAIKHVFNDSADVSMVVFAGTPGVQVARDCGVKVVREAYIDRAYDRSGRIVDRRLPDALIQDPDKAVTQALSIIAKGRVITADSQEEIDMQADTLCLHSDTPGSGLIARALRDALSRAGLVVRAP